MIAVDLPGFGCDIPAGFGCTKEEYVDWLVARVEEVGEPVDIVGHDWGSILVTRLVSVRPDLVRTWAAGGGPIDETYVWHQVAQMWQTPGLGEQVMQQMTPEALHEAFVRDGMPDDIAKEIAARVDERMKAAILPLYRSAVEVGKEWAPDLKPVGRPGRIIWGESDPYVAPKFGQRMAERTGVEFVAFEGCGHWWPVQEAAKTVEALERLWGSA